jgi:hypothetical protein
MGRPTLTLRIAADDRIESVDGSWDSFALARGARPLADAVPGTSLWSLFPDERLRQLYRHLVDGVRTGGPATYDAVDGGSGVRTWAAVRLLPLPGSRVQIDVAWQRDELVPAPAPALSPDGAGSLADALLRVCSWCARVELGSAWEDVSVAIARLGLFGREEPAELSHGICPACSAEQSRGV